MRTRNTRSGVRPLRLTGMFTAISLGVLSLIAQTASAQLVVVDPGHGGRDPGAVGCGLEEAPTVLDVSERVAARLRELGVQVALTRSDDTFVELRSRADFANSRGADAFLSVHANANAGTPASGSETWIAPGVGATTQRLAASMQAALVAAWGLRDRGVKSNNFTVLTATVMPAALVELGFINHCENDAARLGSEAERQVMAEALAGAMAAHLGVDGPPVDAPGVVRGVVFQDNGAGLDDPSVRLPGARVEVLETGDEVIAPAPDAQWAFTLAPGSYTVEATAADHQPSRRACEVAAGGEAWCSIGLSPGGGMPPDVGPPDVGVTPDAGGRADAGAALEDMGGAPDMRPDARDAALTPLADARPGKVEGDGGLFAPSTRRASNQGGCAVAPTASGGGWVLVLLLALAWRRRRSLVACVLIMGAPSLSEAHTPEVSPSGRRVVLGPEAATLGIEVSAPERITEGAYERPLLSPDGEVLVLSGRGDRGLFLMANRPGAQPRSISDTPRAGLSARWSPGGDEIWWCSPEQPPTAVPMLGVDLAGGAVVPTPDAEQGVVKAVKAQIVWRLGARTIEISPAELGDQFFGPRVSPDGEHIVFSGLRHGIFVYRTVDGVLMALGSGSRPAFDPSGRYLVFERTVDEGATLTGADIFLTDLHAPLLPTVALTQTPDRLELSPSLAAGWLVYVADGVVYRARVITKAAKAP